MSYINNYVNKLLGGINLHLYTATTRLESIARIGFSSVDEKLLFGDFQMLRRRIKKKNIFIKWLGIKWGTAMRQYSKNLEGHVLYIFKIICYNGYVYRMGESGFINYLKEVGQRALKLASEGDTSMLYLINLEVLGGYDTVNNRKDVLKEQEEKVTKIRIGAYSVNDEFKELAKEVISQIVIKPPKRQQTFKDFISYRDNWAVGSSCTDGKPLKLIDHKTGKSIVHVKGKLFKLTCYSDHMIINNCRMNNDCLVGTFIKKDEPAKCRNIQNFDTYSFLRCSYIESFIHKYNNDMNALTYWTSIGLEPDKMSLLFEQYGKILKQGRVTAVSIDQSEFDMHQPLEAIQTVLILLVEHIQKHIHDTSVREELGKLLHCELYALNHMWVVDDYKNRLYRWKFGLPSGYKFTALFGTILNAVINKKIIRELKLQPIAQIYQGDDALILLNGSYNESLLNTLSYQYSANGLELNRNKCICSLTSFEYLKHFYINGFVYGIPSRAYKSIIWKKPKVVATFESQITKFNNKMSTLRMCSRRMCLHITRNIIFIVRQMLRSNRFVESEFNERMLRECVHTPVVFGGLGYGLHGRVSLTFHQVNREDIYSMFDIDERSIHPELRNLYYTSMIKRRTVDYLPIKGLKFRFVFARVARTKLLDSYKYSKYYVLNVNQAPLEINWPSDKYHGKDGYMNKLMLEYHIDRNIPVPRRLLCDDRLARMNNAKVALKIIKMYTKYSESGLSVENSRFDVLTYARGLTDLKHMWRASLLQILLSSNYSCLRNVYDYIQCEILNILKTTTSYSSLHYLF